MKKKIEIEIELPSSPNFIRSRDGHSVIAVASMTRKELEEIGREWTKALVAKSRRKLG